MKMKTRSRLACMMAAVTVLPAFVGSAGAPMTASAASTVRVINLNNESCYKNRSEDTIISNYQAALPSNMSAPLYSDAGSNTGGKYRAAVMTSETKQNVLKLTNYYRWLAGLSTFTYTTDQTVFDNDAKGAVLLSVSNFVHTPDKPADMSQSFYEAACAGTSSSSIARTNAASGQAVVQRTLRMWLNDDSYTSPGHRNMFLTRNGQKLAYGMFTSSNGATSSVQTVQYVGTPNPTGASTIGNNASSYAWPAPGNFPADELSAKAWWTVTLNTDKADYSDLSKVTVKIKDKDTGVVYTRTSAAGTVDATKYWGKTIAFAPPELSSGTYLGKNYTVTVANLTSPLNTGTSYTSASIQYDIHFMSYIAFANNSTLSEPVVTTQTMSMIYGNAVGGAGGYTFLFEYKNITDSSWTTLATTKYPNCNAAMPVLPVGTYQVRVTATDRAGVSKIKNLTLKVNNPMSNTSTVSANVITSGQSVTMNGSATGGSNVYEFKYEYKLSSDDTYTLLQDFSSSKSYVFTPPAAGEYSLRITAKSIFNTYTHSASRLFPLYVDTSGTALSNLSSMKKTTVNLGDYAQINGIGSGGTGGYTYSYYYKKTSSTRYIVLAENTGSAVHVFKPGAAASYLIKVVVKDTSGTTSEKILNLTVNPTLKNSSTISATTITKGQSVTLTAKATGGTGGYSYAYYYKKTTSSAWQLLSGFTTASTATFKPSAAATYQAKVLVRDSTGHVSAAVFSVKVNASSALTNTSILSKTKVTAKTSVTIQGSATGGTGSYTYAYYYKKSTSSQWVTLKSFSSATSASFSPSYAATYNIKVIVKDSAGTAVSKIMNLQSV